MNKLEERFVAIALESKKQRDNQGKIRWLYMMNWIVNALLINNPDFNVSEFYKRINE